MSWGLQLWELLRVRSLIDELLRFLSPELVKETALGHFVEESPVDEIFGFDLFGPGIGRCDVIQNSPEKPQP
jgi:hypothetical protein